MVRKDVLLVYIFFLLATQVFSQEYVVEKMPVFKGSLTAFIAENIKYSDLIKKDSVEGVVFVEFSVEKDGTTTQHQIVRGIGEEIDNEVLRVAKQIRFQKPAMNKGKPIRLPNYLFPVRFVLPHNGNKAEQQLLFYEEQDSCFCLNNHFIDRNISENELISIPESDITGERYPVELIIQNVQRSFLGEMEQNYIPQQLLAMKVIVDKTGKARCGVTLRGHDENAFRRIFNLLQKERYVPAKERGRPIMWYYRFILYL